MFLPYPGATLLMPSGPEDDPDRMHLFVVLTNPFDDMGDGIQKVLLVSFSSIRDYYTHDPACVLNPGDHPFVKHESFVVYKRAIIVEANKLIEGVRKNVFSSHTPMSESVLSKIRQGLESSEHITPRVLRFYEASPTEL